MTKKEKPSLAEVLPARKTKPKRKKLPEPQAQTQEPEDKTLLHLLRLVIVAGILVVLGLVIVMWGNYSEGWQNYFIDSVNNTVPFPAASVGWGNWITIGEYNKNIRAMRQFLESKEAASGGGNFDFSTPDGLKRLAIIKKNILNQLIDAKITEIIAKQQNITISNQELNDTAYKILSRDGKQGENTSQLNNLYGWTPDDFKNRVIRNLLYQQKLEDKIRADGDLDRPAKEKLAQLEEKIKAGENFTDLAKVFSDAPSRQYGGLLPAFTRDNAPQVLAEASFRLGVGQISDPIEADDGWHIIKVENKFSVAGKENVQVSHILIEKRTLKQWLGDKKKDFKVSIFLKPYHWMAQMGKIFFKDEDMNQTEDYYNRAYLNEKTQESDFLLNTGSVTPQAAN
jgi:hypothetical protein